MNAHAKPGVPLCPNRADIDQHLWQLFSPKFVHDYPDAQIEIAYADMAASQRPDAAEQFSAFDLEKAADFAEKKNRAGFNVYVGAALRKAGTSGRAGKKDVVTSAYAWADADEAGDAERIDAVLKENGIVPAKVVETGRTPHLRVHVYVKLDGRVTPDEVQAANIALKTLFGSDDVDDHSRLMRLAGTVNYPSKDKSDRGYVLELVKLRVSKGAPAYTVGHLTSLPGKSDPAKPGRGDSKPGRTDDELKALLEATRVEGQWHNAMLRAIASMIGLGWSDSGIKLACAPYCTGDYKDVDLLPMIKGGREKWHKPNEERNVEVERLAQLSLLEYDQQRKQAAEALGVRVSALDQMVKAARVRIEKEERDRRAREKREREECERSEREEKVDGHIAKINAEYALVLAGNKTAVMKFDDNIKFRLLQVGAFTQWLSNQVVMVGKEVTSLGAYWLNHAERREYEGIEFAPPGSAVRPGYYNLFQGFAVEPKEGDCSKFLAHLKDNAARGDNPTFLWIIGWWAQILQQPSVKMETALVLRGPFGAGKTKIGTVMGSLIGDHYLLVASARYITGQFNSHMASLLVLHADEAFWAGDKASVGTLRDLVTGDHHMLEYKYIDAIRIKNHMRLFITGNPDWIVPAGFKERRWAIFDMGEDHMQDHAYFAAIDEEMNNGGRGALMHYLLNFDLSQVDLRSIPKTAALLDQQIESLTPEQAWWLDTLRNGVLPPRPPGINELHTFLRTDLYERYVRHAQIQGASHRSIETKLGMFLSAQLGPGLKNKRPTVGTHRLHCYELPSLRDCRRLFAEKLGQPVDWGPPGWESEQWQHDTNQQRYASDWDPGRF